MAPSTSVRPNRRGARSRELVLDSAERLMAERGYEAATVAALVEEAGVPPSSIYHYFGSKEGVLLAVMERGAERFFETLPVPERRIGSQLNHLRVLVGVVADSLESTPDFLRILLVLATQPVKDGGEDVQSVVCRVRELALSRLRIQSEIVFDIKRSGQEADYIARFALAAFEGAFVASQADEEVNLRDILTHLPEALKAVERSLRNS